MGTFTAVDLSRLPAPDVVEQISFEAIFDAMLADLRDRDPQFTALTESDPAYKILQVCAFREVLVRQRCNEAARAVMLAYAGGADLDQLGALMGVARLQLDPGNPALSIPPTMESDTEFRRRIQLAPEGFSVAGPEGAYIFHALSADPDVLDASATSPTPGDVVVTILSRSGDGTPSPALVSAVNAALSADAVRPLTDNVTVQGATVTSYSIEATVYTFAGPAVGVVLAEAQNRVEQFVAAAHRLGRDIPRSAIFAALHAEGVQRVELTLPAADIVLDRTEAAYCTAITITSGGIDE